jgi:hypothetical protein
MVGTVAVVVIVGAVAATTVAVAGMAAVVVVVVVAVVTPTHRVLRSHRRGPGSASTPTPKRPLRGAVLHPTVLAS